MNRGPRWDPEVDPQVKSATLFAIVAHPFVGFRGIEGTRLHVAACNDLPRHFLLKALNLILEEIQVRSLFPVPNPGT